MNESPSSSERKSVMSSLRANPWMVSTIVLGVLFLVALFFASRGAGFGSMTGSVISENEVSQKVLAYATAAGVEGATVSSVAREGNAYNVMVSVNGQQVPLLLSLDGKYLLQPFETTGSGGRQAPSEPVELSVGDAPVTGNANAKVTVIEFSDFSCPFCAAASGDNAQMNAYMKQNSPTWEPIVTNLMKDYVDTGKVRFAVKYSMGHSGGHPAQLVAWCLNEQGLYWKFYPQAFAHQDDVEDLAKMKALAQTVGADVKKLQTCLDSNKYDARFNLEQQESAAAGAQGTPAFFVNGHLVSGAVPYSQVKALVDAELAK